MYFRWWGNHIEDRMPRPANVAVPDQSANRSSTHGKFWTVLLPDPDVTERDQIHASIFKAVIRYKVGDLNIDTDHDLFRFEFRFEPDSLDHNFHHCELRVYRNGARLSKSDAGKLKKNEKTIWTFALKQFRDAVAKKQRTENVDPVLLTAVVATKGEVVVPH